MNLPSFNTTDRILSMLQSSWSSILNPLLSKPQINSNILNNVALINGSTTINHLLGRKLQGWKIVRQRALASIYDTQDSNPQPQLTLVLVSNAVVTVDLEVF